MDVLLSDVELQAREQDLIVARNRLAKQKLVLARVIGFPTGQQFESRLSYMSLPDAG